MAIDFNKIRRIYAEKIDLLLENLGRTITLYFDETITGLDSTNTDDIRGGGKLPSFKTNAPTKTSSTRNIKALVSYEDKDLEDFGVNISTKEHVVTLKTFLTDVPDLIRAKYIRITAANTAIIDMKFQMLGHPIPRGLGIDRYAISFWKAID